MSLLDTYIEPDEIIELNTYRHWINVFPIYVAAGIIFLLSLFGFYYLGRFGSPAPQILSSQNFIGLLAIGLVLAVLIVLLARYVYRQNRLVVTNERLIQVNLLGILNQTISQLTLDHVQDVKSGQSGLFPRILDYGDLEIETAGAAENFIFTQAPDPQGLAARIMELREKFNEHPDGDENRPQAPAAPPPILAPEQEVPPVQEPPGLL